MEEPVREPSATPDPGLPNWVYGLVAVVLIAATAAFYSAWSERSRAEKLAAAYEAMSLSLNETRMKLEQVSGELESQKVKPEAPKPAERAPAEASGRKAPAPARQSAQRASAAKPAPAEDGRWKKVDAALDEQQRRLAATEDALGRTREEFENRLTSTSSELSGSIARTQEELEVLRKRGERLYYEFDLTKSKQFTRVGPVSIALRKAHQKRQYANLQLIVDDVKIEKKNVNLYEPVLFYPADYAQPLELVINRIEKGAIHGYLSEPRYRQSQLAAKPPAAGETAAAPAGSGAVLQSRTGEAR
jgi:hypothetical protein